MKHYLLLSMLLISSLPSLIGQDSLIDSLKYSLLKANFDTQKVDILTKLSWELKNNSPEEALTEVNRAIILAKELDYTRGLGKAYKTLAVIKWYQSELETCQLYLDTALKYFKLCNDKDGEADVYNNLGLSYHSVGEYGQASEYYLKALKIRLETNDIKGMQIAYNNLGVLYEETGIYEKSLEYYSEALHISKDHAEETQLTESYTNIGNVYSEMQDYEAALENYSNAFSLFESQNDIRGLAYTRNSIGQAKARLGHVEEAFENYHASLILFDSLNDKIGKAETLRNLGGSYLEQDLFKEALGKFEESLIISQQINDKVGKIDSYNHIGKIYIKLNKPYLAITILTKAIRLAEESNNLSKRRDAYEQISIAYSEVGDYENAYTYREKHAKVTYEMYNQEKAQAISRLSTLYEFEEQEREIANLTNLQMLSEERLKRNQLKIYVLLIVALSIAGLSLLIYRNFLNKKRHNTQLSARNEQISRQKEFIERQNLELEEKNHRLKDLNEEKNHLMGVVAHDLKNPLSQIKGLVGIIQQEKENLSPTQQKFISMIEGSADRLTNMIHRILDVKAVESATLNLNIEEINIIDLLKETVNEYELRAKKKSIQLHFPELSHHFQIKVDQEYTRQVFDNLISNALKFSPKERNIYVDIIETDKQKLKIGIRDEGPGISPGDMKKLFGKYQKLSARPTDGESSSGLGLSIVKKYVEAMDGKVWCESTLGKGTTFWVEFFIQKHLEITNNNLEVA